MVITIWNKKGEKESKNESFFFSLKISHMTNVAFARTGARREKKLKNSLKIGVRINIFKFLFSL